jgi:hypothetical protein
MLSADCPLVCRTFGSYFLEKAGASRIITISWAIRAFPFLSRSGTIIAPFSAIRNFCWGRFSRTWMDEFPDSSDLATSRNRGEPCWGLEITSRILYCTLCRSRSRLLFCAYRIRDSERVRSGTQTKKFVPRSQMLPMGGLGAISRIGESPMAPKPVPVSMRCSTFSSAKSNGRGIRITLRVGKLSRLLGGATRARVFTPYRFSIIPKADARNPSGKTLPGMNSGEIQRRRA